MTVIDSAAFIADMTTLVAGIRNAGVQALKASVDAAEDHARHTPLYHDVSGKLRQNTRGTTFGLTGTLTADTTYAFWVENGTDAHTIAPVNRRALAFDWNGSPTVLTRVRHPGTKARPFMEEARNHGEMVLDYGMEYLVDAAIQRG